MYPSKLNLILALLFRLNISHSAWHTPSDHDGALINIGFYLLLLHRRGLFFWLCLLYFTRFTFCTLHSDGRRARVSCRWLFRHWRRADCACPCLLWHRVSISRDPGSVWLVRGVCIGTDEESILGKIRTQVRRGCLLGCVGQISADLIVRFAADVGIGICPADQVDLG